MNAKPNPLVFIGTPPENLRNIPFHPYYGQREYGTTRLKPLVLAVFSALCVATTLPIHAQSSFDLRGGDGGSGGGGG